MNEFIYVIDVDHSSFCFEYSFDEAVSRTAQMRKMWPHLSVEFHVVYRGSLALI